MGAYGQEAVRNEEVDLTEELKTERVRGKSFLTIPSHDSTLILPLQFHYVCKTGKLGKN